jgi:hypothetical protein
MFRASLCPSSGEQQQDCLKPHVVMSGCADCGRVEPGRRQCAMCGSRIATSTQCTRPQPAQPGITTCGFKVLLLGIMMPKPVESELSRNKHLIVVAYGWFCYSPA